MLLVHFLFHAALAGLARSVPLPSENVANEPFANIELPNPWDFSSTKKLAAIGDSYSAGLGAGTRLGDPFKASTWGDWKCSRYDSSYPYLINNFMSGRAGGQFQFHSCSGAFAQEVIDEQVHRIDDGQDVILLSAGGNDAQLVQLLNHCIYQWFSPTNIDVDILAAATAVESPALGLWLENNKDSLVRTCEQQLDITEGLIKGPAFTRRIGELIDKAKLKLEPTRGTMYYTGYAKFWDEDMEEDDYCSKPENSWSFFPDSIGGHIDLAMLTKSLRQRMNTIAELINSKISETIKAHNSKTIDGLDRLVFINYDRSFGDVGGRFCTKGAQVPEKERMSQLAFYPMNVKDLLGSGPYKRDGAIPTDVAAGTFEADVMNMVEMTYRLNETYGEESPTQEAGSDGLEKAGRVRDHKKRWSVLPDGIVRTFHPTMAGHGIIAKLVLWHMAERHASILSSTPGDGVYEEPSDARPPHEEDDAPITKCGNKDQTSNGLTRTFFMDMGKGEAIFDDFCGELENGRLDRQTNQEWTVDQRIEEFQKGQEKGRRGLAEELTPLVKLKWIPDKKNRRCKRSCKQAFREITEAYCVKEGGEEDRMAVGVQLEVGCGTYAYEMFG